jgi:hypothetical protein
MCAQNKMLFKMCLGVIFGRIYFVLLSTREMTLAWEGLYKERCWHCLFFLICLHTLGEFLNFSSLLWVFLLLVNPSQWAAGCSLDMSSLPATNLSFIY